MDKDKTSRSKRTAQDNPSEILWQKLEIERQKLSEAEHITKALISSIGDGIIVVNEYGDITDVNEVALKLLGYSRDELEGEWLPRTIPMTDKEGHLQPTAERPVMQALLTGQPYSSAARFLTKDGSALDVFTTASPFQIKGKPRGVVIVFRDISQQVSIEQAKDEFISLTSHQLRTPLTASRLFLDLLQESDGNLNETQLDYISKIKLSVDRLLELVGDFLNIAKLELGRLEVNPEEVDLKKLLELQIKEIRPSSQNQKIKVSFTSPKTVIVSTDQKLLSEALHNLLSNALRYTSKQDGKIEVFVTRKTEQVTIAIADNGIGIPKEDQPLIFGRLFRASNAIDVEPEGTGLGLYLVKKIALALGGDVSFESQKNKGTTFYLRLPEVSVDNIYR
ncbi:PAS domain-containing sensor histidine kinase [Candidatus Saccharibacteria bacterium]|nr:PAS domain-containing sensor histidine kinase [Candidatus Saccharibacteria bacterium]